VDRSTDNRDPLFNAAASISDGAEIDWKDVGRAAVDDETTAIFVQLQVVERIARIHSSSEVQVPGSKFWSRFTGARPKR
jgi:hypothetical protein